MRRCQPKVLGIVAAIGILTASGVVLAQGNGSIGGTSASPTSCPIPGAGNGITGPTCEQLQTGNVDSLPTQVPWRVINRKLNSPRTTAHIILSALGLKTWMPAWRYELPLIAPTDGIRWTLDERALFTAARKAQYPYLLALLSTVWVDMQGDYSFTHPDREGQDTVRAFAVDSVWQNFRMSQRSWPYGLKIRRSDFIGQSHQAIYEVRISGVRTFGHTVWVTTTAVEGGVPSHRAFVQTWLFSAQPLPAKLIGSFFMPPTQIVTQTLPFTKVEGLWYQKSPV